MVNSLIICTMENTPWRLIFVAAGSSLLLLLAVYFVVLPKTSAPATGEYIASFKNIHVAGHDKGKKVWEFSAENGSVDRDQRASLLLNVTNGILYKDGEIISKDLSAPKVKAFPNSKIAEAYSEKGNRLSAQIVFVSKNSAKKDRFANLKADKLVYNPDAKITTITGNIRILGKDINLRAEQMLIDHQREISDLADKIRVNRKDILLNCDLLHYDSKEERLAAFGKVKAVIKSKQSTNLKSNQMELFVDDKKNVLASGSIEVVQGKKTAVANSFIYNKATNDIILSGNVKAVIQKGKALFKEDTTAKLSNPDAKKLLEEKTFITSDKLIFGTTNGDARAEGTVFVYQKGREAKADTADYSDKNEMIVLTKNVYLKKNKAWIKCEKIEVSVKDESFTAHGSIEAEFRIRK